MCCRLPFLNSAVLRWFILLNIVLFASSSLAISLNISYGTNYTGSISEPNQIDTFYFAGSAGDLVTIRVFDNMRSSTTDMAAAIELRDSLDQLVASTTANYISWASLDTVVLTSDETYKVFVFDAGGDDFGDYGLCIQRSNNPPGAVNLSYGSSATGSFTGMAQLDAYTFQATAGDIVSIHAFDNKRLTTDCALTLAIYGPAGHLLLADTSVYNDWLALDTIPIPESGEYTIFAYDIGGDDLADYGIGLQRTFSPGSATPISYGETLSGNISNLAEIDAFTFPGTTGDIVIIHAFDSLRASSDMATTMLLYGPTGHLVAADTATAAGWAFIDRFTLTATGEYSLLIYDVGGDDAAGYALSIQRTFQPGLATEVNFTEPVSGSLTKFAQIDTYTFTAQADGYADIRCQDNQNSISTLAAMAISLYDQNGALVISDTGTYKDSAKIGPLNLPSGGQYTLMVYDIEGDDFADYRFLIWTPYGCVGERGNIDGSYADLINISDLTYFVDYFFGGGAAPPDRDESDLNGDGKRDVTDLTYLVEYLFTSGASPAPCP